MTKDEILQKALEVARELPAHDTRDALIKAIEAALATPAVPEGWRAVPEDPSVAMWMRGQDQSKYWSADDNAHMLLSGKQITKIYRAMLAIAPKPETQSDSDILALFGIGRHFATD